MLHEDDSNRKCTKETCLFLLTLAMGFLSCSIISLVSYYTIQTIIGNRSFCSLPIDIPGRIVLFLTLYFAAGVCGTFPIPKDWHVNFLPPPFILYRLESWKNLFSNLRLLFTFNCQNYYSLENDPELSPLRGENNEQNGDSSPTAIIRETSPNIQILKTDIPKTLAIASNTSAARYSEEEIASSSENYSLSFDSSVAGEIIPMAKGKSSKPHYITDSSISITESTDRSISGAAASCKLYGVSDTLNDRVKAVAQGCDDNDTPPRTPDVASALPSYPRFPWSYLKQGSDVPRDAKALHKRHLMKEKRELHNKKQKTAETSSSKDSEHNWVTDSDEFNPFANRPLRPPLIHRRSTTGFRGRTLTTPGNIRRYGKSQPKIHKRKVSCSTPQKNKPETIKKISFGHEDSSSKIQDEYCESSLDIKTKVERIQRTLKKFDPSFRENSKATTSGQNTDILHSKIPASSISIEALTSSQNIETCPDKISEGNVSEASSSRQNIETFPGKIPKSNVPKELVSQRNTETCPDQIADSNASEASSRQNIEFFPGKMVEGNTSEPSTSKQTICSSSDAASDSNSEVYTS